MIAHNSKTQLPFVEKFRPKTLDEVVSHNNIIFTLKNFIQRHNIPHFMFYGPPGTGKTSTIEAFVRDLYGEDNVDFMTMNINASEERGIEIVRNKIKNFVSTIPIFTSNNENSPRYKFVILDEADAMTQDAQAMLKQVIEHYTYNARFCLICNCIKKINDAILSRCTTFKFSPLDYKSVISKIKIISKEHNISVTNDGIRTIWKLSNGDMRKVMHILQVISINNKLIDSNTITTFKKYPSNKDSKKIYKNLFIKDFYKSLKLTKKLIKSKRYSLLDVINEITYLLIDDTIANNIDKNISINILLKLRDLEMNIIATSYSDIQLCNLVSLFYLSNTNKIEF
jgi:replication factor C subunit 3/5